MDEKMKKRFISLALALLLLIAAAPGAYALAPLPGGAPSLPYIPAPTLIAT